MPEKEEKAEEDREDSGDVCRGPRVIMRDMIIHQGWKLSPVSFVTVMGAMGSGIKDGER